MMLRFGSTRTFRVLLHVVIAFSVFFSSALSMRRTTELGRHCPTATIQAVRETVKVKTACGCVVEKTVVRAPKLGENNFKQCECSEKKTQKGKNQDQSGELLVWFFTKPSIPVALAIRIPRVDERFQEDLRASDLSPSTPPPLSV